MARKTALCSLRSLVGVVFLMLCLSTATLSDAQHIKSFQEILHEAAEKESQLLLLRESSTEVRAVMYEVSALMTRLQAPGTDLAGILDSHVTAAPDVLQRLGVDQCFADIGHLTKGLSKGDMAALTFLDATGKLPSGILLGDMNWNGLYSECRNISTSTPSSTNSSKVKGQYCTATTEISIANSPQPLKVNWGICLPDSCDSDQIGAVLAALFQLAETELKSVTFNLDGVKCLPTEPIKLEPGAVATIVILSVLGGIIALATLYDFFSSQSEDSELTPPPYVPANQEATANINPSLDVNEYTPLMGNQHSSAVTVKAEKSLCVRLLLCFSAINNGAKILSTKASSRKNLACVHGIRFISMTWVILGHVFAFSIMFVENPAVLLDYFHRYSFMALLSATVSVDTFFLISGTLGAYLLLTELNEKGGIQRINWALVYFHRFWRLTPPLMLVLAVYTTLYHHMGEGPGMPTTIDPNCQKHWWQNLLYINNFQTATGQCFAWGWYLANDMQFFLITPIVVIFMYKWAFVGVALAVSLIFTHMISAGVIIRKYDFPADIPMTLSMNQTQRGAQNNSFDLLYQRPYTRVGTYAVGLLLGYILVKTELKPRLPKWAVVLGWLVAAVACYEVIYGTHSVAAGHKVLTAGVNAFYGSVHRVVWAIGVSWVIFACTTGYGGPVNTFLSWAALVPLSRLTYMAYLVHPIVLFYILGTSDVPFYMSDISVTTFFLASTVLSYGIAFVGSLAFEAPMMGLEKIVFKKWQSGR